MPKVTFTETREVVGPDGKVAQSYEAGKTYDMTDDIAYRWIRRQVAYLATEKPVAKPKAEEQKEADPKVFAKRKPPSNKV
jgi:hypothetical protein